MASYLRLAYSSGYYNWREPGSVAICLSRLTKTFYTYNKAVLGFTYKRRVVVAF